MIYILHVSNFAILASLLAMCMHRLSWNVLWWTILYDEQGHAAPILYAAWAEAGLFPASDLLKLRKIESDLEGHPTPVSKLSFNKLQLSWAPMSITIDMSKWFESPKHLFFKYFYLHIAIAQISPSFFLVIWSLRKWGQTVIRHFLKCK